MNPSLTSMSHFKTVAPAQYVRLYLSALIIVVLAEWIGPVSLTVGPGKVGAAVIAQVFRH